MSEEKKSKFTSGLFLILVLIVLPGVGYFYQQQGLNYHNARKAELDSLGIVGNFSFLDQYNEPIERADLNGKMCVVGFLSADCGGFCDTLTQRLTFIQQQFDDNPNILLLTNTTAPETDSASVVLNYSKKHKTTEGKWFWLTPKKDETAAYKTYLDNFKVDMANGYANQLALVDTSGVIRRYYDIADDYEVNRLIIHLSKFAPRPPEKRIEFAREKEK